MVVLLGAVKAAVVERRLAPQSPTIYQMSAVCCRREYSNTHPFETLINVVDRYLGDNFDH